MDLCRVRGGGGGGVNNRVEHWLKDTHRHSKPMCHAM